MIGRPAGFRGGAGLARSVSLGLLAGVVLLVTAPAAGGHTDLLQGSPGPGQRAGGTIDFIDLVFAGPVTDVVVTVSGPDGLVDGETVVDEGQIIRYEMEPLTSFGRYVVSWEMVSEDGDFTVSNYFFVHEADGFQPIRLGPADVVDPGLDTGALVQDVARVVAVISLVGLCIVLLVMLRRRRAALAALVAERDGSGS